MMFCMHYAFETEAKAKGMLSNVAGSLRKGGRFLGVIPNSDVLREGVIAFHERAKKARKNPKEGLQKDEATPKGHTAKKPESPTKSAAAVNQTTAINTLTEPAPDMPPPTTNGTSTEPPPTTNKDALPSNSPNDNPEVAEWGNTIYHIRFPGPTPNDGIFRPPYGWKYSYFMEEAVEEVPEYVVPWEAFRAIAEDYNLELQYRKTFREIWGEEGNSPVFGPLSERMGVRGRDGGGLLVSGEEMEAASFYHAFCFYKI
ncbi:MAG: hypothetical protein Q9164_006573 [Protoblastenia rupestris]